MAFDPQGNVCYVAFDDSTKVYQLDVEDKKPKILDVIEKPYRIVMDFGVSKDGAHIYCLDSNGFLGNAGGDPSAAAKAKTNTLYLEHLETEKINFDPKKAVP